MATIRQAAGDLKGADDLVKTVAQNLYKLMASKDEYEVARLYSNGDFLNQVASQFESFKKLEFHLAPPLLSKRNDKGELQKSVYGPRMMKAFKWLARARFLRGSAFDIFGYTAERKMERQLLADYEVVLDEIAAGLNADNLQAAIKLANYPDVIKGFGHVKERNVDEAMNNRMSLRAGFKNPDGLETLEAAE